MIGRNLEVSQMEALFLISLYKAKNNKESMTGSEIAKKIIKDLGKDWAPSSGAIYKTLDKLKNNGFIEDTTTETMNDDKRLRSYNLTSKGRQIVPKVASRIQKFVLFVEDCCPGCCSIDS